ncbi:MAG: PAS domain S-box protein [Desulfovibrio sp.]
MGSKYQKPVDSVRLCRVYREIFENAPVGIFTADMQGRLEFINVALQRMLQGTSGLEGGTWGAEGPAFLQQFCPRLCTGMLEPPGAGPDVQQLEGAFLRRDGTSFPGRLTLRRVPGDLEGTLPEFLEGTLQDMTAQHQAEQALARSLADVEQRVEERTAQLREANERLRREVEERRRAETALRRSRENLRVVLDGSYDAVVVHDARGRVLDVNRKMLEMFGVGPERAREFSMLEDYSARPGKRDEVLRLWARVVNGEPQFFEWEARRPLDGRTFQVEVYLRTAEMDGEYVIVANIRDISDRLVTQRRIRTLSRAVEQSPASVVITDPEGRIEYVNPKFTQVTGYSLADVLGQSSSILKSGAHSIEFYTDLWQSLQDGREWRGEFRNLTKDGRLIWESASISPVLGPDGRVRQYVAVKEDITERKEQEERIRHLALYDALTGLPNRTLCMDRIAQAAARVARYGGRAALLYLDLNKFKPVNDTLGHEAGDVVLCEVADRIRGCLREMDTAARMGGDEFVLILQEIDLVDEAVAVARRICKAMEEPFVPCGDVCRDLGVSIGVSVCPDHGTSVDTLLKKADQAMYRVKGRESNGVAVWEDLVGR